MNMMLIAINTKYIHPNMAVRSLKANSGKNIEYREYILKDDTQKIIEDINNLDEELIGLSCYIWNIEKFSEIIPKIKNKKILLGGPEVSYDVTYFFNKFSNVDFIISGEGETSLKTLLYELENGKNFENVPNLSYKKNGTIIQNKIIEENLKNIKHNLQDLKQNQVIYLETSRGCPYNCSYCLSSLEKTLRTFDIDEVKNNIKTLIDEGYNTFKFLDRSFNIDIKHALSVIDFIIKNHKENNVFQLEISGDILDSSILDFIHTHAPKGLFRFEIGIQSTNDLVTKEVKRKQDTKKLFEVIKEIQAAGKIDLHLDLIAGLPKEDLESFKKTFNDTIELRPSELQLGFLKMLRGTSLRDDACKYDYKFTKEAPYEITSNMFLSELDIEIIKTVEQVLEKYYNSPFFKKTISFILDRTNAFEFFSSFGKFFESQHEWINYNLHDLFILLDEYIKQNDFYYNELHYLLVFDYLNYSKTKIKTWYEVELTKQDRNNILRDFFKKQDLYTLDELFKYSSLAKINNKYVLKVYKPEKINIYEFEGKQND